MALVYFYSFIILYSGSVSSIDHPFLALEELIRVIELAFFTWVLGSVGGSEVLHELVAAISVLGDLTAYFVELVRRQSVHLQLGHVVFNLALIHIDPLFDLVDDVPCPKSLLV